MSEPDLLAHTWNEGKTESVVRFELNEDEGGARLTLRHTFDGEVEIPSYGSGWHHHLELLSAQVVGRPIGWDSIRFKELQSEYERRAQHRREAQLAQRRESVRKT